MSSKFTFVFRLLAKMVISSLLLAITSCASIPPTLTPVVVPLNTIIRPVSPPIGPPRPIDPTGSRAVQNFTDVVQLLMDGSVRNLNKAIKDNENSNGARAVVSSSLSYIGSPITGATVYTDRPNENFVYIPYTIDYDIHDIEANVGGVWLPSPGRHLFQSIELQFFCDHWQTGSGTLKWIFKVNQPSLAGPGIAEQVINAFFAGFLSRLIENGLQGEINNFPGGVIAIDLPNSSSCDSIGYHDGYLEWHEPKFSRPGSNTNTFNTVTITLTSIKRLPAHDHSAAVLYNVDEAPYIDIYANYQEFSLQLPTLVEGQQISLNQQLTTERPADDAILVVIVNVHLKQSPGQEIEDSSFEAFDYKQNFGEGTHSLTVNKYFTAPPNPADPIAGSNKPTEWQVGGYEITYQVALVEKSP